MDNIINNIYNIANDLSKLKSKLHYLRYFHEEKYLQNQTENLNNLIIKEPVCDSLVIFYLPRLLKINA